MVGVRFVGSVWALNRSRLAFGGRKPIASSLKACFTQLPGSPHSSVEQLLINIRILLKKLAESGLLHGGPPDKPSEHDTA